MNISKERHGCWLAVFGVVSGVVFMKAIIFCVLVLTHRYLGIAIGWLMLLWCLSGMVMVYISYPELKPAERQAALSTLDFAQCCAVSPTLFASDVRISSVSIEMLADRPVLRIEPEAGPQAFIDLRTGNAAGSVMHYTALAAARRYLPADERATPVMLGLIERDQWTVYPRYNDLMYHVALNDPLGTEVYVSHANGEVVQMTTRRQRFWNWLGAVPHWLYFTALRQHAALWAQVVIWSSLVGCFLTMFGLFLGVWQLRRGSGDRLGLPYRGWKYWHHVPGLLFGVLVLTWVFSGLLSMNPWGWLESEGAGEEARLVRGDLSIWGTVHESLVRFPTAVLPVNTVRIESSIIQGQLHYLVNTREGVRMRHDEHWQVAALSEAVIQQLAQQLVPAGSAELLTAEDDYWYSQVGNQAVLPVLRVRSTDGTRYYLDAISGELLRKMDDNARWYRWLHSGLHRMDFTAFMRARPIHDVLVWLLLGGATVVSATGFWLGIRRLRGR